MVLGLRFYSDERLLELFSREPLEACGLLVPKFMRGLLFDLLAVWIMPGVSHGLLEERPVFVLSEGAADADADADGADVGAGAGAKKTVITLPLI